MINIATILGRVGRKETKTTKNGGQMTVLSIATTNNFKDSEGKQQTTWHNVNCFSKLSDFVEKKVNVSDIVFVRGQICNSKVLKDNKESYIYSLHADEVRVIPQKQRENSMMPMVSTGDDWFY